MVDRRMSFLRWNLDVLPERSVKDSLFYSRSYCTQGNSSKDRKVVGIRAFCWGITLCRVLTLAVQYRYLARARADTSRP